MAHGRESPEKFITHALTGGSGKSNGIFEHRIGRGQKINTAFGMDNVKLAMPMDSSLNDSGGIKGGTENLKHSLTGASAVNDGLGKA